jgi:monothiol glutaredoxin
LPIVTDDAPESQQQDPVHKFIAETVRDYPVVLFMKGVPEQPQCGFSATVVSILNQIDVDYVAVNVLQSDELRQGLKTYSNWPTIPQLFVKGEFVGGCDILREMYEAGELKPFLDEQGVLAQAQA